MKRLLFLLIIFIMFFQSCKNVKTNDNAIIGDTVVLNKKNNLNNNILFIILPKN